MQRITKAIILAGGFGTRLKGIHDRPKCLIELSDGKTILDHQVGRLREHGVTHITLSLHHRADEVRDYARRFGTGVSFVVEPEPLGTGGGVKFATQGLREPVIVCNGDIMTQVNFGALAAKALDARSHMLSVVSAPAKDFGNLELLGDRIVDFREKSDHEHPAHVSEGFYVLFPGIFEHFPAKFSIEKDCFPRLARRGMLRAYVHGGAWLDVGTPERFAARHNVFS